MKYVLNRRWLDQEYISNVNRSKNQERKNNCNDYFDKCYQKLEDRTKKKLDYFLPYMNTEEIKLECVTDCTQHDGDKKFYKEVLKKLDKEIMGKISFSFTDDIGETTSLQKTFTGDGEEIGKIDWLLDEFKYFLKAMSFSEDMTDRIVYLEKGEKLLGEDGEVLIEVE